MWRKSECTNTEKPLEIEYDYNCDIVWIRRNFEEIDEPESRDEHGDIAKEARHGWSYEENKIPMEDWETYKEVMSHAKEISDIHDVSFEMAECLNNNETAISNLETALFEIAEMMNKE